MNLPLLRTPTSIGELAESLNLPRRTVEQAIEQARADGLPVCSDGRGVWLGDAVDVERTLASLRGRLISQYQTYLALRRTLRAMRAGQQMELWVA